MDDWLNVCHCLTINSDSLTNVFEMVELVYLLFILCVYRVRVIVCWIWWPASVLFQQQSPDTIPGPSTGPTVHKVKDHTCTHAGDVILQRPLTVKQKKTKKNEFVLPQYIWHHWWYYLKLFSPSFTHTHACVYTPVQSHTLNKMKGIHIWSLDPAYLCALLLPGANKTCFGYLSCSSFFMILFVIHIVTRSNHQTVGLVLAEVSERREGLKQSVSQPRWCCKSSAAVTISSN